MSYDYYPNHPYLEPPPKPEPQTQTQRLMEFASIPRLFRSTDGESFALFHLGENGVQIVPVQHSLLRDWLAGKFYNKHGIPPAAPSAKSSTPSTATLSSMANASPFTCASAISSNAAASPPSPSAS